MEIPHSDSQSNTPLITPFAVQVSCLLYGWSELVQQQRQIFLNQNMSYWRAQ